jgi:transglutaminase-like putative cysteine protease
MNKAALGETLHGSLEKLLLASILFVAFPHVRNLGLPTFLFFTALVLWRTAAVYRPVLHPGRILLLLVTLAGAVLVYDQHQRFYGREGGAALFLVGLGLKLMEMKSRRDVYLVVYLGFFVALTQYLFSQSIPMALYTLVAVGLSVAVLIGVNGGPALPLRGLFERSAALLAQGLPVMVVLFLFFPRIAGPLWKLPDDGRKARTGLSEIIEPGSVSRLSQSPEPAFRVDFEGRPPPPGQRYWRGPVFWHTDGTRWTLLQERPPRPSGTIEFSGPAYRYTVTLEPHHRKWIFALDLPRSLPPEVFQTPEYLLLARHELVERRQYALASSPRYRTGPLDPEEWSLGLQLPQTPSVRLRELVAGWRTAAKEPRGIVERALRYFREEPFFYTLNPPLLVGDPVETFLFETRKGFCEHYATAFVYLMRVAGIPARVVTGYQGGFWNPVGRFLEVRQADAHAWSEVWLPGDGWTRVDPTAAVAPERIERGIDLEQQALSGEVRFNPVGEALADSGSDLRTWLRQARLVWTSVDHAWNQWVLSYDPENQKRFWELLGIMDWRGLMGWLAGLLSLCGLVAGVMFWPRRRPGTDPAVRIYTRFLKKLARRGIVRHAGEGPLDFGRRAAREAPPGAGEAIARITALFVKLRYGRRAEPVDLERLRELVRAFRV